MSMQRLRASALPLSIRIFVSLVLLLEVDAPVPALLDVAAAAEIGSRCVFAWYCESFALGLKMWLPPSSSLPC
jgi:hypothetical protein